MSSTPAPHLAAVAGTSAAAALEPRTWGPMFESALQYACTMHFGQIRKGNGSPYITHPLAVASLVGEYGGDEVQAIAALLHDLLEDCPVSAKDIELRYGAEVTQIVLDCSDTTVRPKPPWKERKEAYLRKLESVDAYSKLVITADKLHNAQCIVHDLHRPSVGVRIWSRFRATREEELWYFRALVDELGRDWSHDLLGELDRVVGQMG